MFFSKPDQYFTEIIVYMCFTISLFYGGIIKSINQAMQILNSYINIVLCSRNNEFLKQRKIKYQYYSVTFKFKYL